MAGIAVFCAISCEEESGKDGKITLNSEEDLTKVFTSDGGDYTIEFTADNDWNVAVPNTNHYSWSSITPTSGKAGSCSITVTALKNADFDGREYWFDLRCGADVKKITIKQLQKDAISLDKNSFNIPKEGGDVTVKVTGNVDYTYTISDNAKDWITPVVTKGLETSAAVFTVASNEIYDKFEERRGVITFTNAKGWKEEVSVIQAPNERIFEVSETSFTLGKAGGKMTFTVNANFPYTVEDPAESWVTKVSGANDEYSYNVAANGEFGSRFATVKVNTDVEDYVAEVSLKQTGVAETTTLWSKNYGDYGVEVAGGPLRLAVKDNMLLVANGGNKLYAINRADGSMLQEVPIPDGMSVYSMTNDDAGNILVSAQTAFGGNMIVYAFESLDKAPKKIIEYTHNAIWSSNLGNVRVKGDINGKAVVTAFVDVSQYWLAWQITGGVAGEAKFGAVTPAANTVWNPYAACVAPVSDDLNDGILFIGYSSDSAGKYDLNWCSDTSANNWKSVFHTSSEGNENYNCISTANFAGFRFCAIERGAHFSWGASPEVYLLDITDLNNVKEAVYIDSDTVGGSFTGKGACSDVLISTSADGKTMDMFVTDGNYNCLTCIRFSIPE